MSLGKHPVSLKCLHQQNKKLDQTVGGVGQKPFLHKVYCSVIAAGHQPAADHILERFEIFGSMVPWFNQSVTAVL